MGNKGRICKAGAVTPLVKLAASKNPSIAVEAIAALANLAVNGELSIADLSTLWESMTDHIVKFFSGFLCPGVGEMQQKR